MTWHRSTFSFLFLLLGVFASSGWAQVQIVSPVPVPENGGRVGDYAGVIDAATKERLEQKIKQLRDSTVPSIEFAVATVPTMNGEAEFDYSLKIARGWGIGSKEDDNPGLLLFVAVNDRKYFTQISRDLEGDLTDGEAGQIQRNVLVPAFRQQQYGRGIEATLDAFIQNIAQSRGFDPASITGQVQPPPVEEPRRRQRQPQAQASLGACCLIIVVIVVILFFISAGGRGRGGRGGGGGLLEGLILGSILSNMGNNSGGWSGGGFGGSGGGDSGWGGFGGGGDFGGGGAGGDW